MIGRTAPAEQEGVLPADLVCLSHLRWDFVFQRPQHLLGRAARGGRVVYVEEPLFGAGPARLESRLTPEEVRVVVPHLPEGTAPAPAEAAQRALLLEALREWDVHDYVLWYYTPMALGVGRALRPRLVVYDVMDELSLFRFAPPMLVEREAELFRCADVVFTGGASLHAAKRNRHPSVHLFPSSIDAAHFARAREPMAEPEDLAPIPHPRLGFFGVIDERMDRELVAAVAAARPDWQIVLLGPVVKIDPAELPRAPNIHYLGPRPYAALPAYVAGWSLALMPWARNESTRFISPTKTPEYLAAGRAVVSTPVADVVRPYGEAGLVAIAATAEEFVREAERLLGEDARSRAERERRVDAFLAGTSWDLTWEGMRREMASAVRRRHARPAQAPRETAAQPLAAAPR